MVLNANAATRLPHRKFLVVDGGGGRHVEGSVLAGTKHKHSNVMEHGG
jgi:hypothetical protein